MKYGKLRNSVLAYFTEEVDQENSGFLFYRLYRNNNNICTAKMGGRGTLLEICSNPKGEGFETLMLEYVEKKALENNLPKVIVYAIADDEKVKRFFQKNGYQLRPDPLIQGEFEGEKVLHLSKH